VRKKIGSKAKTLMGKKTSRVESSIKTVDGVRALRIASQLGRGGGTWGPQSKVTSRRQELWRWKKGAFPPGGAVTGEKEDCQSYTVGRNGGEHVWVDSENLNFMETGRNVVFGKKGLKGLVQVSLSV